MISLPSRSLRFTRLPPLTFQPTNSLLSIRQGNPFLPSSLLSSVFNTQHTSSPLLSSPSPSSFPITRPRSHLLLQLTPAMAPPSTPARAPSNNASSLNASPNPSSTPAAPSSNPPRSLTMHPAHGSGSWRPRVRSTTGFATPAMKVRRRTVSEQSSANDEDEDDDDSENTVSLFPYLCFCSPFFVRCARCCCGRTMFWSRSIGSPAPPSPPLSLDSPISLLDRPQLNLTDHSLLLLLFASEP